MNRVIVRDLVVKLFSVHFTRGTLVDVKSCASAVWNAITYVDRGFSLINTVGFVSLTFQTNRF